MLGQKVIRRGEDRLASQRADTGLLEHGINSLVLCFRTCPFGSFRHPAKLLLVGIVDLRHHAVQPFPVRRRQLIQQVTTGGNGFKYFYGGSDAFRKRLVGSISFSRDQEPLSRCDRVSESRRLAKNLCSRIVASAPSTPSVTSTRWFSSGESAT